MKKLVALLLAGVMVFGLAACGSNAPAETPAEPPAQETPAETPPAETPDAPEGTMGRTRGDGVFVVGTPEPQSGTFSPFYSSSSYDIWSISLAQQTVLHFDSDDNTIPVLASELPTVSEDGLTMTFNFRDDVLFSDGTPFTANDVAFTMNVTSDPAVASRNVNSTRNVVGWDEMQAGNADTLAGVNVIDDYTLEVTFTGVFEDNILFFLTHHIVSEQQYLDAGFVPGDATAVEALGTELLGTGPFVLDSWTTETGSVHVRNEHYWGTFVDGAPEMVIIRQVNDQMIQEHMEAGDIDYWPMEIMGHNIDALIQNPQFDHVAYTRGGLGYFAFNTTNGATAEQEVRQALMFAFDRDAANAELFATTQVPEGIAFTPATFQNPISAMGPIVRGEVSVDGLEPYHFDKDRANQLLDDAGWVMGDDGVRVKDGERLVLRVVAMPDHSILDTLVPIWIANWSAIGVDVQVSYMPFLQVIETVQSAEQLTEWNIFFLATSYTTNLMSGIRGFFHSTEFPLEGSNFSRINDPEVDRLLDEANAETDPARALELYTELAIRLNDLAPMMPIYSNIRHDFWDRDIVADGLQNVRELRNWPRVITDVSLRQ